MPESSNYPSIVALPTAPRMLPREIPAVSIPAAVKDLQQWAADLSRALASQFNSISKPLREGKLTPGPHAPSHAAQTGSDPLATAAHSGGYAVAAAVGTADTFLRSDAVLVFPEALGTLANRAKSLTLTDDAAGFYSAILTASAAFSTGTSFFDTAGANTKGLSLMAPGGTIPFCISPTGTMGRGNADAITMMRHDAVTVSSASRVRGWNLVGLTASGTGGITGIELTVLDAPSGVSTQVIFAVDVTARAAAANAQGAIQIVRATQGSYTGASASRGAVSIFAARSLTSYISQTVPSLAFYDITQVPLAGGTISGSVVGFKQATAFGLGATRRGVQVVNSVEVTTNDVILSGAGKRFIAKDAIDGNFYALSFQNGILMITNLGATPPTT